MRALSRTNGTVETVETVFPSHRSALALLPDTFEKARKACPGYDVYALEGEWRNWASSKEAPKNADAAFIAFCKTYAERHPLNP
jgi:hypothetical protein